MEERVQAIEMARTVLRNANSSARRVRDNAYCRVEIDTCM